MYLYFQVLIMRVGFVHVLQISGTRNLYFNSLFKFVKLYEIGYIIAGLSYCFIDSQCNNVLACSLFNRNYSSVASSTKIQRLRFINRWEKQIYKEHCK